MTLECTDTQFLVLAAAREKNHAVVDWTMIP
jgi:hypothetical protein